MCLHLFRNSKRIIVCHVQELTWTDKTNGLTPVRPVARAWRNDTTSSKLDETFECSPSINLAVTSSLDRSTPVRAPHLAAISLVTSDGSGDAMLTEPSYVGDVQSRLEGCTVVSPMRDHGCAQLSPIAVDALPVSHPDDMDLYTQIAKRPKVCCCVCLLSVCMLNCDEFVTDAG